MPSSVIRTFYYDAARRDLVIVYQTGRRYTYENFPQEMYAAMQAAFSKGEFFNQYIRDHFHFVRGA